ncbi:hypothetical protein AAD001_03260 [Colwelliaceae bacterium 6471]
MKFISIITGCVLLIAGCSTNDLTGYRPYSAPGGYKDKKIEDNLYIVEYHGNNETSEVKVKELWSKRASELCPKGYDILAGRTFKNDKGIVLGRMIQHATVYPMFKSGIRCK